MVVHIKVNCKQATNRQIYHIPNDVAQLCWGNSCSRLVVLEVKINKASLKSPEAQQIQPLNAYGPTIAMNYFTQNQKRIYKCNEFLEQRLMN